MSPHTSARFTPIVLAIGMLLTTLATLATLAMPAPAVLGAGNAQLAPTPRPLDVRQGGNLPNSLDVRQGGGLPAPVLAPGDPPLTQQTADNLAGFFEWLLDAPLTQGQRQDIEDAAIAVWLRGDTETMGSILAVVSDFGQIASLGETQRMQVRQALQPTLLAQARQQPNDELSSWMLGIYDAAHTPVAPGTPPLTRQVAEAYAEVQYFLLSAVATGKGGRLDQEFGLAGRDAWARAIADDYPRYSPAQQQQLTQMPLFQAAIREAWPTLPDAERGRLRDQWRPVVQGMLAEVTCDTFVSLAKVDLVEPAEANLQRYSACLGPAAPAAPATTQAGQPLLQARPEDLRLTEDDVRLDYDPNAYTFLSNMQTTSHVGTMNMLSIMGNSPYRYTTVYRR